jgi:hypothetical protein
VIWNRTRSSQKSDGVWAILPRGTSPFAVVGAIFYDRRCLDVAGIFQPVPHPHLTPFEPQYWLTMQIAMIWGYATSFPMNRWLILAGLKEAI